MDTRILDELKNAQEELDALEAQYKGHNVAQQQILNKLKLLNYNYENEKRLLEAKIEYLKAQIDKRNYDSIINNIKKEESLFEAMLDI